MKQYLTFFLMPLLFCSCLKYLDINSNPALAIPNTVQGYRELIDNDLITNNNTPGLGHLGSDDYMLTTATWKNTETIPKNAYIWNPDIFGNEEVLSWSNPYEVVYYCNVVLDGLPHLKVYDTASQAEYNAVLGTAMFVRAFQFYALQETFGQPWRPSSADRDLGIPLRLAPDPHQQVGRSSVQKVYDRILLDAKSSIALLPAAVQFAHRNRPCKPAAYALISRAYLSMQQYDSAKVYTDSCLLYYDKLVDYNELNLSANRPFPIGGNDEVLYQCTAVNFKAQYLPSSEVDTGLYTSYADNDLRKTVFFRLTATGGHYFRGQYSGKVYLFSGLAMDELYLTRAECYARLGRIDDAMNDLNTLLARRWKTGTFQLYTATTSDEALQQILMERRKETLFRETRWADLRRLNQDAHYSVHLRRVVNDSIYTLMPDNPRYAYPIPKEEVRLSGIEQNPR